SKTPMLVHARWPKERPAWRDEAVEAQVALAQQVVTAVREVRARYSVPPSQRIDVVLRGKGADTLGPCLGLIGHMAGAKSVELAAAGASKPRDAATTLAGEVEAWVLGVVDVAKERARLQKEAERLQGQIAGIARRLENPGFLAKAPADVVEKERQTVARLRAQLDAIEANLRDL